MSKLPDYCPYLGLRHNRGLCLSSPTPEHRCYTQAEGVAIAVDQGTYCLSPLHTMCPLFQAQSEAPVAEPGLPDLPEHDPHELKVIPIDRHAHRLPQAVRKSSPQSPREETVADWSTEAKQPQQPPAEWHPDVQARPQRTAEEEALAQRLARPQPPVQRTAEEEALAQRLARPRPPERRTAEEEALAQRLARPQHPVQPQRPAQPQRPSAQPQPPTEWRGEQRVAPAQLQRPSAQPQPPAEWRGEQRVAPVQRPPVQPQPPAEWRGERRAAPAQRPPVQRLLPSQPVAEWQSEQRPVPPPDVVPPRLRAQARKSYTQVIAQSQADRDWLSAALTAQAPAAPLPKRESSDRPAWAMPEHAALPGPHQSIGSKLGDISNILASNRFRLLRSTALGAIAPVVVLTLAAVIGIGSWQRADLFSVQGQSATTNVPTNLLSEGETSSETQTQPTALAPTSTAVAPTPEPSSVTEDAAMATTSVLATDVAITPVISVPTATSALPEPTPTFPSTGEGILIVPTITGGGAATPMVMTLYFPDPASATIVPAQYEIREPDGVTIANVLKGLLAGPPANLAPTLAPGTQVLSVAFDGGTLSIDLDRPIPGILERRALELTLAQFPGITSVRLLVKGAVL